MSSQSLEARSPWERSIYNELHRIAERTLARETSGHSLQPTLLVNDAYMRLLDQRNIDANDRSAVLAAGATIIRRLLVDYARKRKALRRGGDMGRRESIGILAGDRKNGIDILELHEALETSGTEKPAIGGSRRTAILWRADSRRDRRTLRCQ